MAQKGHRDLQRRDHGDGEGSQDHVRQPGAVQQLHHHCRAVRRDAGQAQSELTLRLLTLSYDGRGNATRPWQITDENQTALPDWESAKHDFVHGDWSQRRIALAHGVRERGLAARAKKEGWVRLVGTKKLKPGAKPRDAREAKIQRAAVEELRRRDIIRRLLEALGKRLVHLEKRMAPDAEGEPTQSAADAERDARTLSGLARLYAKLVELDDSASAKGKPDQD